MEPKKKYSNICKDTPYFYCYKCKIDFPIEVLGYSENENCYYCPECGHRFYINDDLKN